MSKILDRIARITGGFGSANGEGASRSAKTHDIEMSMHELQDWMKDNGLNVIPETMGRGFVVSTAHVTGIDPEDERFAGDYIGVNEAGETKYRIHSGASDHHEATYEIFEKLSYNRAAGETPVNINSRTGEVQRIPRDSDIEVLGDFGGTRVAGVAFKGVEQPVVVKPADPALMANEFY